MKNYLCTFSGKYGDILWSLPTARYVSRYVKKAVDFGIMPAYASLLPLLQQQSYIREAFVIDEWKCSGSPHGDQPWEAPALSGYEGTWHLTYRNHPRVEPLIDFIAWQQGVKFEKPPVPFIETGVRTKKRLRCVAYAFNSSYIDTKLKFLALLQEHMDGTLFVDVSEKSWQEAAEVIRRSTAFLGCRSANFVLAMGVGTKAITIEPHNARASQGPLGIVFGCPYGKEHCFTRAEDAKAASGILKDWLA